MRHATFITRAALADVNPSAVLRSAPDGMPVSTPSNTANPGTRTANVGNRRQGDGTHGRRGQTARGRGDWPSSGTWISLPSGIARDRSARRNIKGLRKMLDMDHQTAFTNSCAAGRAVQTDAQPSAGSANGAASAVDRPGRIRGRENRSKDVIDDSERFLKRHGVLVRILVMLPVG